MERLTQNLFISPPALSQRAALAAFDCQGELEANVARYARNRGIVQDHIVPNLMPLVLVNFTLGIGQAIIAEAGLSFLGLGVQPPTPSWGNMLTAANNLTLIQRFWWLWVPPGIVLVGTVIALNLIGDALRDILDPRRRGR